MDFKITHPFHPHRGVRLRILTARLDAGVRWLWYLDGEARLRRVKLCFTDRAEPDGFLEHAGGDCAFRTDDLSALVAMVARWSRSSGNV